MLHNRDRFNQWLPALFDGEFDWDFLKPAFNGTKIMPMDFDAVVERRGHILIFETKAPGTDVSVGQRITLTTEWKRGASIIHLEGKTPETIVRSAIYWEGSYQAGAEFGELALKDCDWTDVLFQVRRWFCRASDIEMPSREEWDRQLWLWDYEKKTRAA